MTDERDFNRHLIRSFCKYMLDNGWTLAMIDRDFGTCNVIVNVDKAVDAIHAEEMPTMRWHRDGKGHWMMINPWDEDGQFIIDHSDTPELDEATVSWLS